VLIRGASHIWTGWCFVVSKTAIAAFDATTGKQICRFDLIPSGKEPGGGQVLLASKSIDIFGPALDYFDVIGIDANNRHR
jgi:hypothetical protein